MYTRTIKFENASTGATMSIDVTYADVLWFDYLVNTLFLIAWKNNCMLWTTEVVGGRHA